jgi:hypothetical protein
MTSTIEEGALSRSHLEVLSHLFLADKFRNLWGGSRSDSRRSVLWTGETGWKPILHCAKASLRWMRGHALQSAFFPRVVDRSEDPM